MDRRRGTVAKTHGVRAARSIYMVQNVESGASLDSYIALAAQRYFLGNALRWRRNRCRCRYRYR